MIGKNRRFWTNSAVFSPPIIFPVMIKRAIIFYYTYLALKVTFIIVLKVDYIVDRDGNLFSFLH